MPFIQFYVLGVIQTVSGSAFDVHFAIRYYSIFETFLGMVK